MTNASNPFLKRRHSSTHAAFTQLKEEHIQVLEATAQEKGVSHLPRFKPFLMQMRLDATPERFWQTYQECKRWLETSELELAAQGDFALAKLKAIGAHPVAPDSLLGMYAEDLCRFVLILGDKGSGKSQLALQLTYLVAKQFEVPCILATPKDDFTVLEPYLSPRFLCCHWTDLGLNPIRHGSVGVRGEHAYLVETCEILSEKGVISGKHVLQQALMRATEQGVTDWPGFVRYFTGVSAQAVSAKPEWKRNLDALLQNTNANLGRPLSAVNNTLLENVLRERQVLLILTDGLGEYERMLLGMVLNYVVQWCKQDHPPEDGPDQVPSHGEEDSHLPKVLLVFDEGQSHLLRRMPSEVHGAAPINRHLTQDTRAYRIGILGMAHQQQLLSVEAQNLAHTLIVMPSGHADLKLLRDALGDAYESAKNLLPRQGIVLMKSRVRKPLRIETFESPEGFLTPLSAPVIKEMSAAVDRQVERVMAPVAIQPVAPKTSSGVQGRQARQTNQHPAGSTQDTMETQDNLGTSFLDSLDPAAHVVLEAWRKLGGYGMQSEIIDEVSMRKGNDRMSSETCRRVIKQLISNRYLRPIRIERQGKPTVALDLNEKGRDFMTTRYDSAYPSTLRGEYLHNYACHRVAMWLAVIHPDAETSIGDTKLPKQIEGVSEFDVAVLLPDGQLHVYEIDVAAGNLTQERINAICQVADKLTLVTLKEQVEKLKQFENSHVSVETIARYNLSRKELAKLADKL